MSHVIKEIFTDGFHLNAISSFDLVRFETCANVRTVTQKLSGTKRATAFSRIYFTSLFHMCVHKCGSTKYAQLFHKTNHV